MAVTGFFFEISFIAHTTEEKTRFGPKAAERPVSMAVTVPSGCPQRPVANKMAALDQYAAQCKLKLPQGVLFGPGPGA